MVEILSFVLIQSLACVYSIKIKTISIAGRIIQLVAVYFSIPRLLLGRDDNYEKTSGGPG